MPADPDRLPEDLRPIVAGMLDESRAHRLAIDDLRGQVRDLLGHPAVWAHPDADPALAGEVAAAYCGGLHPKTLARAAKAGELAYVQTGEGGRLRYRLSALHAWLDAQTTPTRASSSRALDDIDWGA